MLKQKSLNEDQLRQFYCDDFVGVQVDHFEKLIGSIRAEIQKDDCVIDVGGGVGFFAERVQGKLGLNVRVLDSDPISIASCIDKKIDAQLCDALSPTLVGNEKIVCFNLILHHLVGFTECETQALQKRALSSYPNRIVFVNEIIYESYIPNVSGKIIYLITRSAIFSSFCKFLAKWLPALNANTFGTGVRFRSRSEWIELFNASGLEVVGELPGQLYGVPLLRRIFLLIKASPAHSFLLKPSM